MTPTFIRTGFLFCLAIALVHCKSRQQPERTATATVLVQCYESGMEKTLETNFAQFDLTFEKMVSRPVHIYLFSFNPKKIEINTLLQRLKASALVKEAQENKEIQPRKIN